MVHDPGCPYWPRSGKKTFALCGIAADEQVVLERTLKRAELLSFFANLPACLVVMEAGTGAHSWVGELKKLGRDPRIIHPSRVAPYRHGGKHRKNDRNDAHAIYEAVGRPKMRFVPKSSPMASHRSTTASGRFCPYTSAPSWGDSPTLNGKFARKPVISVRAYIKNH